MPLIVGVFHGHISASGPKIRLRLMLDVVICGSGVDCRGVSTGILREGTKYVV